MTTNPQDPLDFLPEWFPHHLPVVVEDGPWSAGCSGQDGTHSAAEICLHLFRDGILYITPTFGDIPQTTALPLLSYGLYTQILECLKVDNVVLNTGEICIAYEISINIFRRCTALF